MKTNEHASVAELVKWLSGGMADPIGSNPIAPKGACEFDSRLSHE